MKRKTLWQHMFTGLLEDPPPLIEEILSTWLTNVITSSELTRKLKAAFFTAPILEQVV
jgi:hypothetical protein